ncbi:histidine-tRNA ligase [Batrachochytrium salamandrivorans]|nr:histidine-tRNA ligase [Batrachochytrium salamandrivorans]KAH9261221.1 histidine-tRNA ligase [Batrachochytrium salamandrivorans]
MQRSVRGTADLFGTRMAKRKWVGDVLCSAAELCGYLPVETPVIEPLAVFQRTLGPGSEVVAKEMFEIKPRAEGDDLLVLRPENTASVVRAVLNANLQHALPLHLYYLGPQFRYERPQRGRQRQFTQFGVECFGKNNPETDLESIVTANLALTRVLGGENKIKLKINTLGAGETDRQVFTERFLEHLTQHQSSLSEDTRRRISEGRVLRVLDSKDLGDISVVESGPKLIDFLPPAESARLHSTIRQLQQVHGMANVELDHNLVRGLDYYSQVCFEFVSQDLGGLTVCAGGRYDGLAKTLGHATPLPAIGWACGVERLELLVKDFTPAKLDVLVVPLFTSGGESNELIQTRAAQLVQSAREMGLSSRAYCGGVMEKNSLKKALKEAETVRATFACVVGQQEVESDVVLVRDMATATVTERPASLASKWMSQLCK